MKNNKPKSIIFGLAFIALVSIVLLTSWNIFTELNEYKSSENKYKELAEEVITEEDNEEIKETTPAENENSKSNFEDSKFKNEDNPEVKNEDKSVQNSNTEKYVNINKVDNYNNYSISINFDLLKNINPDIVAWIKSDDEVINYPVLKGNDNDFYLNRNYDKSPNKCGSIFLDQGNNPDFSDDITLIYGHNMNDGSMFASLEKYTSKEIESDFSDINIFLPDNRYIFEISNVYLHPGAEKLIINFPDDKSFYEYMDTINAKSIFSYGEKLKRSDNIAALVTCENSLEDERIIILGKLKRY